MFREKEAKKKEFLNDKEMKGATRADESNSIRYTAEKAVCIKNELLETF